MENGMQFTERLKELLSQTRNILLSQKGKGVELVFISVFEAF